MPFDPSIILSGKQYTGPDANETMRTLADLSLRRVQTQKEQASLADLLNQQGQERSFADIVRQNADTPEGIGTAALRQGLPGQALGWMTKRAEVGIHEANANKLAADLQELGIAKLRNRAAAVKTPEQYAQFIQPIPPQARQAWGLPDEFDANAVGSFVAGGVPAEKRAELDNRLEAARIVAGQKVTDTGTGQRMQFNPETGRYDVPVGAPKPPKPAAPEGGKPLSQKDISNRVEALRKAISTTEGRSHVAMPLQQSINRAEALEALVKDETGQVLNLAPGQVREATTALAQLISQGNAPALQQIEEMTPHTMAGDLAKFKQKWMNEPTGADAQKFLKQILETAAREKSVALKQIRAAQIKNLPYFMDVKKAAPSVFNSALKAEGYDPATIDDNGLLIETAPAPVADDIALDGPSAKRLQELRAAAAAKAKAGGK